MTNTPRNRFASDGRVPNIETPMRALACKCGCEIFVQQNTVQVTVERLNPHPNRCQVTSTPIMSCFSCGDQLNFQHAIKGYNDEDESIIIAGT